MEWRQVAEFPGFEVSESGEVRNIQTGYIRKPTVGWGGYIFISIGGTMRVAHRLVAKAFIGEPPTPKHMACHNDGTRTNNHYSNLRWDTCKGNLADRVRHGTMIYGTRNGRAVLTPAQVSEIRSLYRPGVRGHGAHCIGKRFGIGKAHVFRILDGRLWGTL